MIKTFYNKIIGGNLGYHYTDGFSEAFQNGKIRRIDTHDARSLIAKLQFNTIDGAILDKHEARYWLKEMNLNTDDYDDVYHFKIISKLRMRLHKSKQHLIAPLNKVLQEMKDNGEIMKIVEKYISY